MSDLTNSTWSEADANNTQPSPNGFPAGILPSEVGGAVRAIMGATKRFHTRANAMITSSGAVNTYALTYGVAPTTYAKGEVFRFFAHITNTSASTININGLGARALLRADGSALSAGEIIAGQVVEIVFDGASFLHQPAGGRNFKDSISIIKDGDTVLTLEDTSAPTTSFRRKNILGSKNVAGGNDWLFRQTRPADGVNEDFVLKTGTAGTIFTTGNFDPGLKANLAGATFTGSVFLRPAPGTGYTGIVGGTAERSGYIEFRDKDGIRNGYIGYSNGTTIDIASEKGDFNFVGGTPRVAGNQIWHGGNFDPASKATLNATAYFTGLGFSNRFTYVYTDPNVDNLVVRTGNSTTGFRFAAFAADGVFTSASHIRANGDVYASGRVVVGEGQANSSIEMRDSDEGTRYIHNNSGFIGFLGADGNWKARVADTGAFWTAQLGDLNTRIEDRGRAYATVGRDEANANVNANFFNKTSGTPQNVVNIPSFNAAAIDITRPGVLRARLVVDGNGTTILQNGDTGDNFFYVTTTGAVWTKQFGDLNNRIEDRASAHALAQAGARVAKGGDTMTGDLNITKSYPQTRYLYPGVRDLAWQVRENGGMYLWDYTANTWNIYIGPAGDVQTRQLGDLNGRIESRAEAWASTRQANLGFTPVQQSGGAYQQANKIFLGWDGGSIRAQVDNLDLERVLTRSWVNPIVDNRFTYAGDLGNEWNVGAAMAEPYGGAVMTSRTTNHSPNVGYVTTAFRWRYLQKQDSYGNWYTVGYV